MCLTTVGPLFYDAVINVTLMEGSAGRDGNVHFVTNISKMLNDVGMELPKRVESRRHPCRTAGDDGMQL